MQRDRQRGKNYVRLSSNFPTAMNRRGPGIIPVRTNGKHAGDA
jgi:hypothetical protein